MKSKNASIVLNELTRTELSRLAKLVGVPVGKSKNNTVSNLSNAVDTGNLQFKSIVTLSLPPKQIEGKYTPTHGRILLMKKIRSYKADKTLSPVPVT